MPASNLLFSQPQVGNNAQLLFGESETPTDAGDALVTGFSASGVGARGASAVGATAVLGFVSAGLGNHQQIVIGVGAATAAATVSGAAVHTPGITAFGLALSTVEAAGAATHTPNITGTGAVQHSVTAAGVAATAPSIQGTGAVVVAAASSGAGAHAPPVTGVGAVTVAASSSGTALTAPPVLGTGAAVVPASLVSGSGVHIAPVVAQGSALVAIAASGNGQYFDVIAGVGAVTVVVTANGAGAYIEPIVGVGNALLNFVAVGAGQHVPAISGVGDAQVALTSAGVGVYGASAGTGAATVSATAAGTGAFGVNVTEMVTDSAVLNDFVLPLTGVFVEETAQLSDLIDALAYYVVPETATLGSVAYPEAVFETFLNETAQLSSLAVGAIQVAIDVVDAAVLNDAVSLPEPQVSVVESAVLNDAAYVTAVRLSMLGETARLGDYIVDAAVVDVEDVAVVLGAETSPVATVSQLVEGALVNDATFDGASKSELVYETATLNDLTSTRVALLETVHEEAFVYGEAILAPAGVAWTANLGNWAMSRYTGFSFNSMTPTYAASADGVYLQGTDNVPAKFESGRARLNKVRKSKLEYVYTDCETPQPMDIIVAGDSNSGFTQQTYTQVARDLTSSKAAKTKVGRGFNSTYYSVTHQSDDEFVVHKAELVFADTARRI